MVRKTLFISRLKLIKTGLVFVQMKVTPCNVFGLSLILINFLFARKHLICFDQLDEVRFEALPYFTITANNKSKLKNCSPCRPPSTAKAATSATTKAKTSITLTTTAQALTTTLTAMTTTITLRQQLHQ